MSDEAWPDLLRTFNDRTAFHTIGWIRSLADAYYARPFLTGVFQRDVCLAIWPFLDLHKGFLRVIGSPLPGWATPYMGPLFREGVDIPRLLSVFMQHRFFRRHSYFACKVVDRDRCVDLAPFGFTVALKYDTYLLDLTQSEEQLWSNLDRQCRNHVRKAQKNHVVVQPETGPEFIDEYWSMTVETFAKAQTRPTHNKEIVEQMWRHMHATSNLHALSAFHEGHRVATVLLPCDDQTMYYWGGASHLKYRDLSASNLLQWEALCHAKRLGKRTYDFISTTGGPGKFKKSFGPQAVMVATHWERSPSRLMRALKGQYERYMRKKLKMGERELVEAHT